MNYGKPMVPMVPEVHTREWPNFTRAELRDIAKREWAYAQEYYNAYEREYAKHYYYKSKFDEVTVKLAELKKEIRDDNHERRCETCPSCGSFSEQEGKEARKEGSTIRGSPRKRTSRSRATA